MIQFIANVEPRESVGFPVPKFREWDCSRSVRRLFSRIMFLFFSFLRRSHRLAEKRMAAAVWREAASPTRPSDWVP